MMTPKPYGITPISKTRKERVMRHFKIMGLAFLASFSFSGTAHAECTSETAKDDLTTEQVVGLYDCIKEEMRAKYAKSDNAWATDYTSWGAAFTAPGGVGNHGSRFLTTFVNDVGFDEYVKFAEDNAMPVGTVIAKESFNLSKKGKVKVGPLFFMEKVAAGGEADEFGNWVYSAIQPNGKAMKVKQSFCHDCHGAFDYQDSLGYPEEDLRVSAE